MDFNSARKKVLEDFARLVQNREKCLNGKHCPEVETGGFGTGWGNPVNVGVANAPGVAPTLVRSDHVHAHPDLSGLVTPAHAHADLSAVTFGQHHGHFNRMIWGVLEQLAGIEATTPTVNRVYLSPLIIEYTLTVDRVGICNFATLAGNVIAGLYRDNGDTPTGGALLVSSVSTALAGAHQKQEITIANTQLTAGLYWMATIYSNATYTGGWMGIPQATQGGTLFTRYYGAGAFALTDPCPATAYVIGPVHYVRVASVP